MRRSARWLWAIVLCGVIMSACKNDGIDEGDALPAVVTNPTSPTVVYMTEDTESEETVSLPEIVSTSRTASTEDMPDLATTTTTPSVPAEPTEPTISVLPDVPNVPIGQFTTTQATYPVPSSFSTVTATSYNDDEDFEVDDEDDDVPAAVEYDTGSGAGIFKEKTPSQTPETTDPFSPYTIKSRTQRPYSYSSLNEKGRYVYDAILQTIGKRSAYVDLSEMDGIKKEDYCDVYSLLYNDENSMYYLDTNMQYAINTNTNNVRSATVFYKYTSAEIERMQAEIDSETANILAKITPGMSQYDIVKVFYDYLAFNVVYDEDAPHCNDIYGVFVDKRAICGGYSKAFSYLCDKVGIETLTITGDADNVPHMWNMIKLGGDWYHIDITYAVTESKLGSYVRYDYFCVTDEVIDRSRVLFAQDYTYPAASATKCNYFVKNGLIANSYDEAYSMLYDGIIETSARKELVVQIRCGSKAVYDEAIYNFFSPSQKKVLDLMEDALTKSKNKYKCDNISYGQDDSTYVIKLFLEYTN
ncbi:MAG: hypothetical protein J1F11_07800 [Oscillospiraceae bacterium]|nr:hypothetical protein [Oscillospiraceae bacterium]